MWSALKKNSCIPSLNDTNLPFEYDEQRSTPTQQDFSISSHHPCFLNEARKREIESDVQFVRSLPTISISTISIPKYSQSGRVAGIIVINITNKPVSSSTSASASASPAVIHRTKKDHKQGRLHHHTCKYHFPNTSLYLLMKSSSEKK